ncbi:MAG: AraC-like transcriptional regulator QhpR [Acetobacter cibinongensis]
MSSPPHSPDRDAQVLAAAASGVESFFTQSGGDIDRIAGRAGLSPAQFVIPTQSLNLRSYCRLFSEAARDTQDQNIGLRFGQQFLPQQLGLIGYVALCSATVEQAVRNLVAYFGYHQANTVTRLSETADSFCLEYLITDPAIQDRRHDAELTLGMFCNILRAGLGPSWSPQLVLFAHDAPEQAQEHQAAFQAEIRFSTHMNALVFSKKHLQSTIMPMADPALLQVMQSSLLMLAQKGSVLPGSDTQSLKNQVMAQLVSLLPQGTHDLREVAKSMGLTPWTLQRRLADLSLSYTALLDEARQSEALRLLALPETDVSSIAAQLGYTETSAFSRAFRRWVGVSPRVWRQTNGRPSKIVK